MLFSKGKVLLWIVQLYMCSKMVFTLLQQHLWTQWHRFIPFTSFLLNRQNPDHNRPALKLRRECLEQFHKKPYL